MDHRQRRREQHWRDQELNRGDYRGDFGPEGQSRFDHPRRGRGEGWRRGRVSGGYGSQFDAWSSGAGFAPAGFGFGPAEYPERDEFRDEDWQVTRPARGRGTWAGDWENERYRGRGPKGYRRSDDRIRDEVCEQLTEDWHVDATDISIEVHDGEVTLSGTVSSREQRRRAEDCAERVRGVHDVFNRLRVVDDAVAQRAAWEASRR
jgi:hypothetical protein